MTRQSDIMESLFLWIDRDRRVDNTQFRIFCGGVDPTIHPSIHESAPATHRLDPSSSAESRASLNARTAERRRETPPGAAVAFLIHLVFII